jgi:hypothetical protein
MVRSYRLRPGPYVPPDVDSAPPPDWIGELAGD